MRLSFPLRFMSYLGVAVCKLLQESTRRDGRMILTHNWYIPRLPDISEGGLGGHLAGVCARGVDGLHGQIDAAAVIVALVQFRLLYVELLQGEHQEWAGLEEEQMLVISIYIYNEIT